jgi:hypothetical protein
MVKGKKVATGTPVKGSMTVGEAGRKGGNTTKERYGHDHYINIQKKSLESRRKIKADAVKYRELVASGKIVE